MGPVLPPLSHVGGVGQVRECAVPLAVLHRSECSVLERIRVSGGGARHAYDELPWCLAC